ncbi:hypothetical protein DFP72DRAFT_846293 [Ephemerocybe angulata]|uniref:Uncharacterized protein n=1 Tax=Ephemerocybe angulata TaxID=980116 RepID=A0A8H6I2W8_9AGAR|nr:hypothetical protein DFP72DRAFT_846293 [Tulosesus angulatus]
MHHVDPDALSATNSLHELTRGWIEHLRSVLYHARVIHTSPLAEDHPLSEDFPFVRVPYTETFSRFRTRAHFDNRPPLAPGEEIAYPVTLQYHPGTATCNAFWSFASGSYVIGQLTLAEHIWEHETDMSWLSADRFLLTMSLSVTSKRSLRLSSRVWELQGSPPSDNIISNLELFEIWTEEDRSCHKVIGSRYIRARRCMVGGCGFPLHLHQEQFCSQHTPQIVGI